MKIVFLIGNGFDIKLNMNTRYKDFYKFYIALPQNNEPDIIKQFKKDLGDNKDIELWSDLENVLGYYLGKIEKKEDAVILHEDLIDKLSQYMGLEEKKHKIDKTKKEQLFEYISKAYFNKDFTNEEINEIGELLRVFGTETDWEINIITFNYTKTIENMIGDFYPPLMIMNNGQNNINLSGITHIHGFTNKEMVLGVNDDTQIANEIYKTETDITDRYIKTNSNNTYGTGRDKKCQKLLEEARIVVLYGLSIGDTDLKWWKKLSHTLINGKIIFFDYLKEPKPNDNQGARIKNIKEQIRNKLLTHLTQKQDFEYVSRVPEIELQRLPLKPYKSLTSMQNDLAVYSVSSFQV